MARKTPTGPPANPSRGNARRPAGGPATDASARGATSARSPRSDAAARKARVAELKKAQRSRERRTMVLIVAACSALLLVLAGAITYGVVEGRRSQPDNLILTIGVPAASAGCDAVTTDPATGSSDHVGPGTNTPNTTKVQYSTVPPSSGAHFAQPVLDGRQFYTTSDAPAVESLVHNLEHGYTVLWYLPSEATAASGQLQELASVANKLPAAQGKFIVAPWNEGYGQFPAGKKYALSHWSATENAQGAVQSQAGHRELCGSLSGEVVQQFVTQFPKTDAPEPNGA